MLIRTSAFIVVLQQGLQATPGITSPPTGDTVGYWQQRVAYTITATLDERAQKVRASGTLRYVNNSPDTLRDMYVHQYLNAFRPHSKWSDVDEREGRNRFQHLEDPDFGYERFTAPVRVNGVNVAVDYPGTPDSTVAHFALPAPLAPHDSLVVAFEWDARPSTTPRRQGRRGRHWDLAQWYPKVAVYDRAGWEFNALRPAGEFYSEFATYDVTLLLAQDQVIGATGVPVSGDPGWTRAIRAGAARLAANAYGSLPPPPAPAPPPTDLAPGYKAVRFFARDVHHFAWSASPDYRYEGGTYVRALPSVHWPTWDTVSIHALYRQGDDSSWGGLKVVRRTIAALQWLEAIYGPYAYPQMTVLHRLDGGGTEFPMMQMNGSSSQGLILHEGGHVFTYGILANNEWRNGWMDEGLTSYQTDWAQGLTPQERVRAGVVDRFVPLSGYRARGLRMALPNFEATALDQTETDLRGGAEPIGTVAHEFRDFSTYNDMIYTRAQVMYGQLRDVLGDSVFVDFLHDYYNRWALKHVDERAMRASAERVSGRDLGWFFQQWVHHTGVMNYQLRKVAYRQNGARWTTDATVVRRGEYRHPVSVGVRTSAGWTFGRISDVQLDRQTVSVTTDEKPIEVKLDPLHFSWDWDRRDDVYRPFKLFSLGGARTNFDWPFLDQADRDHDVILFRPSVWYSDLGRATVGLRMRGGYVGWLDQFETGLTVATSGGLNASQRPQYWLRFDNPTGFRRPKIGWHYATGYLDDLMEMEIGYRHTASAAQPTVLHDFALTYTDAETARRSGPASLIPELWDPVRAIDFGARTRWTLGRRSGSYWFAEPSLLGGYARRTYGKAELSAGRLQQISDRARVGVRVYGGMADGLAQRGLFLSASDPVSTYYNHWWRPAGAILKRPGVDWLPLGGAALRGYHWALASRDVVAGNLDASRRILQTDVRSSRALGVWMHAFADVAHASPQRGLADAGIGVSASGRIYDRDVFVRIDSPFYVSSPNLAIDRGRAGTGDVAPRWAITFTDLW